MAAVALPPRARSRQGQHGAGPGPGLPDFETLLASGGSTIRVRASEDRRTASDDEDGGEDKDDEELLEDDPPTPPRKSAPHPSTAAMAGRISSPRSAAPGGSGAAIKGREAALRDIEREMALDEVDEEDDGAGSYASEVENQLEQPIQPGPSQEKAITGTLSSNTHRLSGTAPLPSSSNPDKALPMSPPDMVEHDLRRRSQYRSPGLATSPDLATLVKTAKASNGQIPVGLSPQQPPALDSAFTGTSSQHQLPTSTSPATTLRGPGSPRSRVSSESGTRRQYTPTLTTVSSLQAAMDLPRARAVSTRSDSGTSFVHVNQQPPAAPMRISSLTTVPSSGPHTTSNPPTMPDSDLGTVTSVWSGGSASTSRRTKKLTKGGGDENVCFYFPRSFISSDTFVFSPYPTLCAKQAAFSRRHSAPKTHLPLRPDLRVH